jgi:DNA ligase-associated metallophosphoesterase
MKKGKEIRIRDHIMVLHPLKALWWPAEDTLICSDVHIGKGSHFRNAGIPVPKLVNTANLWNLVELIEHYTPSKLIFLGDLFHSGKNKEWLELTDCLDRFPQVTCTLVLGNHEFLDRLQYENLGFRIEVALQIQDVIFTHEPSGNISEKTYNVCGHLHPAIRLTGKAKLSAKIPCFWQTPYRAIMPAFGEFTGTSTIKPSKDDTLYGFLDNQVVQLN